MLFTQSVYFPCYAFVFLFRFVLKLLVSGFTVSNESGVVSQRLIMGLWCKLDAFAFQTKQSFKQTGFLFSYILKTLFIRPSLVVDVVDAVLFGA